MLVSDTVGFVRRLPHQLVEAFRSTLEVVREADLLVHVVDGSAEDRQAQIDAVRTVLEEIGAGEVPRLLVLNKADRVDPASLQHLVAPVSGPTGATGVGSGPVVVSARTGQGMDELLRAMGDRLRQADRTVALMVPFDRGDVLAAIHREGEVVDEAHGEGGTRVQVVLDAAGRARFREFVAS